MFVTLRFSRVMLLAALTAASSVSLASAQTTTTTYGYDPQGQLKTVARPSDTIAYTYDQAANRTAIAVSGGVDLRTDTTSRLKTSEDAAASKVTATDALQALVAASRAVAHARAAPIARPGGSEER